MRELMQNLGIDPLNSQERLDLIGEIWDRLVDSDEPIVVPEWHQEILTQRLAAPETNPEAAIPWEVVIERLLAKS